MGEAPNVLHHRTRPDSTWSTTNMAESIPGVPTPLCWSIWAPAGELAVKRTFHSIGALSEAEAQIPPAQEDRLLGCFYGRAAMRVNLICEFVERVPGSDSVEITKGAFGVVPDGYTSRSQPKYYPRVAARALTPFFTAPRLIAEHRPVAQSFRDRALAQIPESRPLAARKWLAEGVDHWMEGLYRNTLITMGTVQPVIDQLTALSEPTGVGAQELMAGYGNHEETAVVMDAWACSRGQLEREEFIRRHGYHGWHEGEISSTVWREDSRAVDQFIAAYAERPETEDPVIGERERVERRAELEARFLAALPAAKRPTGKLMLRAAERYVPLRGVGKVSFLHGIDASRAAARHLGHLLADAGEIDDPSDVFFFTLDELQADALPANARELAAERRAIRERYETLAVADSFTGEPEPVTPTSDRATDVIEGTAASPGVVEGRARVVTDRDDAVVEDGEILVGYTTDPSWASLMFLSSGLIADIGGTISHTAVVARELGLPCVVGTKVATTALKTGDLIRLDGTAGRIEVLERAD